jgi:outer membrane biosynthesis protein TonB
MRAVKFVGAVLAVAVGAWVVAFVLGLAADQADQKRSRAEIVSAFEKQLAELRAQSAANRAALNEVNRRCGTSTGCTPVEPPPVEAPEPRDDGEVQEPEIQEPEIQDPEVDDPEPDDPEVQDPEVDDAPVPGEPGTNGKDGKDGLPGPQGEQGPVGPAGRGIQSLTCGDDAHWHVTYTDGTTEDAGVCRVAPLPNGDPKP